jgi:hypothetical protein
MDGLHAPRRRPLGRCCGRRNATTGGRVRGSAVGAGQVVPRESSSRWRASRMPGTSLQRTANVLIPSVCPDIEMVSHPFRSSVFPSSSSGEIEYARCTLGTKLHTVYQNVCLGTRSGEQGRQYHCEVRLEFGPHGLTSNLSG